MKKKEVTFFWFARLYPSFLLVEVHRVQVLHLQKKIQQILMKRVLSQSQNYPFKLNQRQPSFLLIKVAVISIAKRAAFSIMAR